MVSSKRQKDIVGFWSVSSADRTFDNILIILRRTLLRFFLFHRE